MILKNDFWLTVDDNEEMIAKGSVSIVDKEKFDTFEKEMHNIDNYIFLGSELIPGSEDYKDRYTENGFLKYKYVGEVDNYICAYRRCAYLNPKAEVWKFLKGVYEYDKELLDLFKSLTCGDSKENQMMELVKARNIINELKNTSLTPETIKEILIGIYPNFGVYATECLDFTDIDIKQRYNLSEINNIVEYSNKAGLSLSPEVKDVLEHQELAQTNGKILTLAREVHRISYK